MANQLQSELIRQARGMRQSQKSAGSLAADSVNIISALEKLSQGLESPVQKFADATVSKQLTANVYDRNLQKRTKATNIRKMKSGALSAIGERLDSPDIDLEQIEQLRIDLEEHDTSGPDHDVLEAQKLIILEDAKNKEAWLGRKESMLFGTEDNPGIYRSLNDLEQLRKDEFKTGQFVFSNAKTEELEKSLEALSLKHIKAAENKYTTNNDFIKNRLEDLGKYIDLRENFQQLDAVYKDFIDSEGKITREYGKFDMPDELITLTEEQKKVLESEEGITHGTYSDLMNETMRQLQSGDIDKARRYYDMGASARNRQIEKTIDWDRQAALIGLSNYQSQIDGTLKSYAQQLDQIVGSVNAIQKTLDDDGIDVQVGVTSLPSVTDGEVNFDGLRENTAISMLQVLIHNTGASGVTRGQSDVANRWIERGAKGTEAVMVVKALLNNEDVKFPGEAKTYGEEKNKWGRKDFGSYLDWSGWGNDEQLGAVYYGRLLDLWEKLEQGAPIMDSLSNLQRPGNISLPDKYITTNIVEE